MGRCGTLLAAAAAAAAAAAVAAAAATVASEAPPPDYMVGADGTHVPLDGWVSPLPAEDEALASSFCNIDRRPTLSRRQFEAEYRCVPWRERDEGAHTSTASRIHVRRPSASHLLAATRNPWCWVARPTSAST